MISRRWESTLTMAQSGAPRAAVIPAEVLSDMMDETVSHFDVTCPTKCSILLRLTSRRFPSYTFAGKKKMYQWVYSKCNNPITLRASNPRQMKGFKTVPFIVTLFGLIFDTFAVLEVKRAHFGVCLRPHWQSERFALHKSTIVSQMTHFFSPPCVFGLSRKA